MHKAINQRQHAQLRTPSFFFATINLPESTIFFRFPTSAKCRFYITISQFYFSEKLIVSTNFEPNNMSNFVLFRCMRNLTFRSTSGEWKDNSSVFFFNESEQYNEKKRQRLISKKYFFICFQFQFYFSSFSFFSVPNKG